MNLLKKAQAVHSEIDMIIESCEKYNVPKTLLESLDGVLHYYIQAINSGKMKNFDYGDLSALANIFALASMIGVTDASGLDTTSANHILNLYRTAKPGDGENIANEIEQAVDGMDQATQTKFKGLANAWGKNLSQIVQNPNPDSLKNVANRLLKAVTLLTGAVDKMETMHRGNITKAAVQSNNWRKNGVLSNQR